jgi:hypothetical protein
MNALRPVALERDLAQLDELAKATQVGVERISFASIGFEDLKDYKRKE